MRKLAVLLLGLLLVPYLSLAYTNPGKPTGFVNDFAGVLSAEDKSILETKLSSIEQSTGDQISIAIIKSLGGDTVENFATKLFADWGVGQKGKDNGALILVAIDDRQVRIEVGYGLEPTLTDIATSQIISGSITPKFKTGDYAGGLSDGVDQINNLLSGGSLPQDSSPSGNFSLNWIYYLPFIIIYLGAILGRSKSWWLGGVLGAVIGGVGGVFLSGSITWILIGIFGLGVLGLLFDFFVSKQYEKHQTAGTIIPWWLGGPRGGGGSGGGSGFGGFGGGMSGGGGSSGKW